jgi:hypothetical protein
VREEEEGQGRRRRGRERERAIVCLFKRGDDRASDEDASFFWSWW